MDKYQGAYIILVCILTVVIIFSSQIKREEGYIVEETHKNGSGFHLVKLVYNTGETVWLTLNYDGPIRRLNIRVSHRLGIHVTSCSVKICGNLSWVGLLTMRGLDATVWVNNSLEGYYINLTDIGVSGVNSFSQDYLVMGEEFTLHLVMEVKVGQTVDHLEYSYVFETG